MRIAIIGGGLAGLAICYFLSPHADVTLFDPQMGSGASRLAHLLHAYVGPKGLKSRWADQGIKATLELLQASSEALGRPVYQPTQAARQSVVHEAWLVDGPAYLEGLWKDLTRW
jgi:glycine/D-amino acid oxidase-like deaminating enzyme